MFFPFSFYRNRQIEYVQEKKPACANNELVLPPSALYIHDLLHGSGILVEALPCSDENWVPLYLPDNRRLVAVHIRGDSVLTKIKAKAFVKKYRKSHLPPCPVHWVYPSTFYADCRRILRRLHPFN
jgi:hypothetical protein